MKILSKEEFDEAPNIIQYVYMMGVMKKAIGSKMYDQAISEHPEYFPDEISHRNNWLKVPEEVHNAYWAEYLALHKEVTKDVPPSLGIFGWADNPEAYVEWINAYRSAEEGAKGRYKELHDKHYSKYGIKFKGITFT
jgi:hypothetical protein